MARGAQTAESGGRALVWGLPLDVVDRAGALGAIERLVAAREPVYVVTANLHTARLCAGDPELRRLVGEAALVLADGMPLVWASRREGVRLPERVAGSDLVPELAALSARRGYRLFLLGAAPGVAEEAARQLVSGNPGLEIAGIEAPDLGTLDAAGTDALLARIRAARADILLAAFGQPKGERWLAAHHRAAGVPVSLQVGASLDFVAGASIRAPRWMQASGLEWLDRLRREPRRLGGRYARDAVFAARAFAASFRRASPVPGREGP